MLLEVKMMQHQTNPQSKLRKIQGFVKHIDEKPIYLACPDCRKKVIEEGDKSWKCEHCAKTYSHMVPTYMINA